MRCSAALTLKVNYAAVCDVGSRLCCTCGLSFSSLFCLLLLRSVRAVLAASAGGALGGALRVTSGVGGWTRMPVRFGPIWGAGSVLECAGRNYVHTQQRRRAACFLNAWLLAPCGLGLAGIPMLCAQHTAPGFGAGG